MKAAVYLVPGRTHENHLTMMTEGLRRHGLDVLHFRDEPAQNCDFAVVWGERVRRRIAGKFNKPILVMERGYIGDRFHFTSMGWDGLNGRAQFPDLADPSRWNERFSHLLKPWRAPGGGYALLVGQVAGDAALAGVNIAEWYAAAAQHLFRQGWEVFFRQHPVDEGRRVPCPNVDHARRLDGSLSEAFSGADLVVTYNSNTGVEAVLAGVPTHTEDEGSMVYDLTSHDFSRTMPDREAHFHRMAWAQWSPEEIRSGAAWDVVRNVRFKDY